VSISPVGLSPSFFPPMTTVSATSGAAATTSTATGGTDFGKALASGLDDVQQLQSTSDDLAVKAATGDLKDAHDYTIAATQANLATQMTVTMRNKAVDAFNEILRMPL
jgi:flagellar hook-basal body complex protein FliE